MDDMNLNDLNDLVTQDFVTELSGIMDRAKEAGFFDDMPPLTTFSQMTYNNAVRSSSTMDDLIGTMREFQAEMAMPSSVIKDNGAVIRLVRKSGIPLYSSKPSSVSTLMGVEVRQCPWVPRGMAVTKDASGKLIVIDARTDEERADDAAKNRFTPLDEI